MLDLKIRWEGVDDLLAVLADVAPRLRERALRPAIDKATRLVARAMKAALTRRRTGMLRASLGTKVIAKLNRPVYGLAGPRRSFRGKGEQRTAAKWRQKRDIRAALRAGSLFDARNLAIVPTRYAHLVEKGHGRGKGRAAANPYPFVRPAVESTRAGVAAILREELTRQINRFADRLGE